MAVFSNIDETLHDISFSLIDMVAENDMHKRLELASSIMNSVLDISYLFTTRVSGGSAKKEFLSNEKFLQETQSL